MQLVKVKFLKEGVPAGHEYTYWMDVPVEEKESEAEQNE